MHCNRGGGRAAVFGRDDDDSVLSLEVEVDDDQPRPGADEEAKLATVGQSPKLRAEARETSERRSGSLDPLARIGRKAVGQPEPVQDCRALKAALARSGVNLRSA
jgi:hypothetical protein